MQINAIVSLNKNIILTPCTFPKICRPMATDSEAIILF